MVLFYFYFLLRGLPIKLQLLVSLRNACHPVMCSVTESLQCPIQVKEVKEAVSKADSQRVGVFSEYGRDGKAGESEAQRCCVTDGCFLLGTALGYRTKADCLTTK